MKNLFPKITEKEQEESTPYGCFGYCLFWCQGSCQGYCTGYCQGYAKG